MGEPIALEGELRPRPFFSRPYGIIQQKRS